MGNVLTVLSIVGGWMLFVSSLKGELNLLNHTAAVIEKRLTVLEQDIQSINKELILLAKQEVMIQMLLKRIEDIEKKVDHDGCIRN